MRMFTIGIVLELKSKRFDYGQFSDIAQLQKQKLLQGDSVAVVVPTLNEEANLRKVLSYIKENLQDEIPFVDELIVLDGGSIDKTCEIAKEFTSLVFDAREGEGGSQWPNGKGLALWRSQFIAKSSIVTFVDADIENFNHRFISAIVGPLISDNSLGFSKGFYVRPFKSGGVKTSSGGGRVTEILVRPFLSHYFPVAAELIQPLSGEYGFRKSFMHELVFYTGYGVESSLVLDFIDKFGIEKIAQVDLGERVHRNRPLADLGKMAYVILQTLMEFADKKGVINLNSCESTGYYGLVKNEPVCNTQCVQSALPLGKELLE